MFIFYAIFIILFSSEKYVFEKLAGLSDANRLFKDIGGGTTLFKKTIDVNSCLLLLFIGNSLVFCHAEICFEML